MGSEVVATVALASFGRICRFKRSGVCTYIRLDEACLAGSRLEHLDRIDCETCCTPACCDVGRNVSESVRTVVAAAVRNNNDT